MVYLCYLETLWSFDFRKVTKTDDETWETSSCIVYCRLIVPVCRPVFVPHMKYYAPCDTLRGSRIINEHDECISQVFPRLWPRENRRVFTIIVRLPRSHTRIEWYESVCLTLRHSYFLTKSNRFFPEYANHRWGRSNVS